MTIRYHKNVQRLGNIALVYTVALLLTACGTSEESPIDRKKVVSRHNIINHAIDSLSSLTVGNGVFAFTVDVTGLQTFPLSYAKGVPLGTQSEWAWNSFKNTGNYRFEETLKAYDFNNEGRAAKYSIQWKEPRRNKEATDYFRENAHRLQLGNVGFELRKMDGRLAEAEDITDIRQELDLWTGEIKSAFQLEGVKVEVQTAAHQQMDQLAVKVNSPLIKSGQLKIYLRYPYPTGQFLDEGTNYANDDQHQTALIASDDQQAVIRHQLQGSTYFTTLAYSKSRIDSGDRAHYFILSPDAGSEELEFSCIFTPEREDKKLDGYAATAASSEKEWDDFWSRGAAIDFDGSTDPRAAELERRVVLSQYLTKVQCAGNYPPQETGLTFNSWYGKPHTEMHWWHAVHFALWGRPDLMEKSLRYYASTVNKARAIAERQGYEGVRWQKMSDNEGNESPSSVAAFLIWQQPHFIYLAELAYRDQRDQSIIEKYKDLVFATATFMASYPTYDKAHDRYNLGKGVIPAQEVFPAAETVNPTYEVAYWDWALRIAQEWRTRAGLAREEKWDEIINKLAPLPVQDNVYLATESAPDSYINDRWRTDHPAVLGALGMVPESPKLDKEVMKNTLDTVWKTWFWERTWGWDFPMTAMNAARLGLPEKALDALFMDIQTNTYLKNGHNYQDERLRIYLPGNGGVLTAVAMMAGGWDAAEVELPGFPEDGSWKVKAEGFKKMP